VNRILSCVLRALSLALLLVFLPWGACAAGSDETSGKAARIDALVSRYEEYEYLNGAVLVAEHGKVVYDKGVGYANMESHTPNTPHTKFGIASITKQFAAVLVVQQVAEGKLRLGAKITEYLPRYRKDTGERMTIEQPLHHTSGLPADFDSPEFSDSEDASRHYTPQAFAEKFCRAIRALGARSRKCAGTCPATIFPGFCDTRRKKA
jgi:CubicO group peptidase (beta-lactamase class C family)